MGPAYRSRSRPKKAGRRIEIACELVFHPESISPPCRHSYRRRKAAKEQPVNTYNPEMKGAPRSLDCFAIAGPEGRASFDALRLAMTIVVRPQCNLL